MSQSVAQTPSNATIHLVTSISDDVRPVLYAQHAGLFRQAGLDVVIERSTSGAVAAQAVLAGSMDIGKSSLVPLITAYAKGIPFVLIAPSAIHLSTAPNSGFIVAANSPIRSALDLQGKVVACIALDSISTLGIRALIDREGGDSSTIHWVELPTSSVAAAIEAGRVDAGETTEPYMTQDLLSGKVRYLVDELQGYRPSAILESAFYTTRAYVSKNRDLVGRFINVMHQAAAYSDAHEAETVALYVASSGLDPNVAAHMRRTYTPPTFDAKQIQPVIDVVAKYKVIPRAFDAREMIAVGVSP